MLTMLRTILAGVPTSYWSVASRHATCYATYMLAGFRAIGDHTLGLRISSTSPDQLAAGVVLHLVHVSRLKCGPSLP